VIRKTFRRRTDKPASKIDAIIDKYNLPREYLSINRKSIVRGIWIGLFWGFIPMPFQMIGVLITTPLFRFNVPIAISMVWLSNPFTMPPMYYMEYKTGNFILGWDGIKNVELAMYWFKSHWDNVVVPLYVGASFYSIIVSTLVAVAVNWLWIRSAKHEWKHRISKRKKNKTANSKE
jgi:uncharacterized protein (DUF2062 family)